MTTHSGQGDQPRLPAATTPREGVVLPSNGEPTIPEGSLGGQVQPSTGQPWGQPWGPDATAATPPAQAPPSAPPTAPPSAPSSEAAAVEGPRPGAVGTPPPPVGPPPVAARVMPPMPPLPPPTGGGRGGSETPGPPRPPLSAPSPPPVPPRQPAGSGRPDTGHGPPSSAADATQLLPPVAHPGQRPAGPAAPAGPAGGAEATSQLRHPLPPEAPRRPAAAAPPPRSHDSDQTQMLPPQPGASATDQTQMLPPQPGASDSDQTQMLPPQSAATGTDRTQALPPHAVARGRAARARAKARVGPPPTGAPFQIRPGTPGDRPPPAEFDNLFRAESAAGTDATQQLPIFEHAAAAQRGTHGSAHDGPRTRSRGGRRAVRSSKDLSRTALIVIVVLGCAIAGLAAGAALSTDDHDDREPSGMSASTEPSPRSSAAVDPAETQAKDLNRLLGDSNNSRSAVITSVQNIKTCDKLGQSAARLRAAAQQRGQMVTRLGALTLDELPRHQALTDALTSAWQASARADNHYAAWADQVAGKKGCREGRARATSELSRADAASGEATKAKQRAAGLWNPTARSYGLPERAVTEL